MHLLLCVFFSLYIIINVSNCESSNKVPIKFVSVRTSDRVGRNLIEPVFIQRNGQILFKRAIPQNTVIIQSDIQKLPSVKSSSIDDFYDTREFHELLKEYKLKVDKSKLPSIRDVVSLLGTTNSQDTLDAIREFASTKDGLDLIKSYLDHNEADDRQYELNPTQPKASKYYADSEYNTNSQDENGSWWNKLIKWLGLSQSTKIDSAKKDLEIFSTIVPLKSNSFPSNVKYIGNFIKPAPQMKIPINPPFKVFNSQSIDLSNQPNSIDVKTLPTIRMTEHQYNEMMKSVNLNSPKLAKYDTQKNVEPFSVKQLTSSDIKRSFSTNSQPVRTSYDLPTRSLYKANPDEIDKISKILSEKLEDKNVVSAIADLTAQQHS